MRNASSFLTELYELLRIDRPGAPPVVRERTYVYGRSVRLNDRSSAAMVQSIEFFRRACFVLEAVLYLGISRFPTAS